MNSVFWILIVIFYLLCSVGAIKAVCKIVDNNKWRLSDYFALTLAALFGPIIFLSAIMEGIFDGTD